MRNRNPLNAIIIAIYWWVGGCALMTANSGPNLPDSAKLGTLRKIAAAVNRRVVVRFEPINRNE